MPLGVGRNALTQFGHGAAVTDGGHHIAQKPPLGHVVQHAVGRRERHTGVGGDLAEFGEPPCIVGTVVQGGEEVAAVAEHIGEAMKGSCQF